MIYKLLNNNNKIRNNKIKEIKMIAIFTTLLTFYISQNNIITLLIAIEILLLTITVK